MNTLLHLLIDLIEPIHAGLKTVFGLRVPKTKWGQKRKLRALLRKRSREGNESLDYAERELYLELMGLVGDEVDAPEY